MLVDALDGVVARLVVAVDRALVAGDLRVRHVAPARQVLFVPQQAVVAVVGLDRVPHRAGGPRGAVVVESDQVGGTDHAVPWYCLNHSAKRARPVSSGVEGENPTAARSAAVSA